MWDKYDLNNLLPVKDQRTLIILQRWLNHEITSAQADREMQINGIELPKGQNLSDGNSG